MAMQFPGTPVRVPDNHPDLYYRPTNREEHQPLPTPQSRRSILLIGKVCVGKKSIANRITGSSLLKVDRSMASVTRPPINQLVTESSGSDYSIHIIDTVGQYERKSTFPFISELRSKLSIHLALFVLRNGPPTKSEVDVFHKILIHSPSLHKISALVITHCETLDDRARQELVTQYRTDPYTKDIAKAMGKGIYTVGFPHTDEINEVFRQIYEQSMSTDRDKIQELVEKCDTPQNITWSTSRDGYCVVS